MAPMTSTRVHLLALPIVTASLALAACGGDDNSSGASGDDQAQFREAALEYAECMRRNGVDMPDPVAGEGIRLSMPDGVPRATVERAERSCRKHLEDAEPPELSEEEQREMRERALKHAQCMREHGIDFPDPTFGEGGRIEQRLGGGIDPNDPAFEEAERECGPLGRPPGEGS